MRTTNALRSAAWRRANPGRHEANLLMSQYGFTREQAEVVLVERQGGLCAVCRQFARLVVDHDHKTGAARAMLCPGCNTKIGAIESPVFQSLLQYLKECSHAQEYPDPALSREADQGAQPQGHRREPAG